MKISFIKMSGAGNDFILVDERMVNNRIDWSTFARATCSRRTGIGADGLLVVSEPSGLTPAKMSYFNADGSSGSMCGNGGRCAAAYLMDTSGAREVDFFAVDHLYHAEKNGLNVRLKMKDPKSLLVKKQLNLADEQIMYSFCDSGSPHVMIDLLDLPDNLRNEVGEVGILRLGRAIRMHTQFSPGGTNVNFVEFPSSGHLRMRTYERGVEDETLACGTGAVACSIIAAESEHLKSPITVDARSGERLLVYFTLRDGKYTDIYLEGSANKIFEGAIEYEG